MKNIYDDHEFFDEYAKMTRSQYGLSGAGEWLQFKALFPDLKGKRVLDLGCGYGWHCQYAVTRGAAYVLGIDSSQRMIQEATARNADSSIEYRICAIEAYDYPPSAYDCVISNLALHYIADLDVVFSSVYGTLRTDGVFLINIEHPIFTAGVNQEWHHDADGNPQHWPVDRYFLPGERSTNFLGYRVTKQHHTLTQILMGLIHAGFLLDAVEEPMPSVEMMETHAMPDEWRRPMMLLIRARKSQLRSR